MDTIRSRFYVPSLEKETSTKRPPHDLKQLAPLKKQASILLHEAKSDLEKHRSNLFNQQGVRIKNRLETYLELDTENEIDNTWQ